MGWPSYLVGAPLPLSLLRLRVGWPSCPGGLPLPLSPLQEMQGGPATALAPGAPFVRNRSRSLPLTMPRHSPVPDRL